MGKLSSAVPISPDLAALILRVGSGLAIITHGWPKLVGFTQRMNSFPDPFGLGSPVSLSLVVFAEFFCAVFLILGFYTRAALIPLVITMSTVIFKIHWADPFSKKELPLLFLLVFISLFLTGPGKYSIDGRGK